jgi:phosphate transport system protein
MLATAIDALEEQDQDKVKWVREHKAELTRRHNEIEERVFSVIALYQPVAKDMRTVVCALRMIVDLDRIGRYGKDISKMVSYIKGKPAVGGMMNLPHMGDLVLAMVNDVLRAFESEDLSPIAGLGHRDDAVDALNKSVFRESLTYMMEDPRTITPCTDYIMVARFLERCGDHACDMGEKIHYMVTGERIEIK